MKGKNWIKHIKIANRAHNFNSTALKMGKNSLAHPGLICYYPDRQGPLSLVDNLCISSWPLIPQPYPHHGN